MNGPEQAKFHWAFDGRSRHRGADPKSCQYCKAEQAQMRVEEITYREDDES